MLQRILWLVLAAVHLLPALALLNVRLLARMYGVHPDQPAFLLLQHRAALFACVFIACVWAMFDPRVRRLAAVVAAISMVSFLVLFRMGHSPAHLQAIALVDLVALPVLAATAYLAWRN